MRYAVFSSDGRISKVIQCSDSDIHANVSAGEDFTLVDSLVSDVTHYIEAGVPVPIPAQTDPNTEFDYTTKAWVDKRTLQEIKDAQWVKIKQSRSVAEYAGFMWDGSKFDSDQLSQARITGAVSLAMMSPTFSIEWTLFNNTTRTLNQIDMMQVGGALGTHVATQFSIGVSLREQINSATTKAEIESVVW